MDAFAPRSLSEALALRAEHPGAVPVAGAPTALHCMDDGTCAVQSKSVGPVESSS